MLGQTTREGLLNNVPSNSFNNFDDNYDDAMRNSSSNRELDTTRDSSFAANYYCDATLDFSSTDKSVCEFEGLLDNSFMC